MKNIIWISLLILLCSVTPSAAQSEVSVSELVKKANDHVEGESSFSIMRMTIVRPNWERTVAFKNWVKGSDYALTLITSPAKEKGQTFLKRGNNMWNYLPSIGRMIQLPPSMMSQGWMGSDYTNDDVLNETSLVEDYSHTLLGEEQIAERKAFKIEMIPHDNAQVVWGKVIAWIASTDHLFLKMEYYDEDDYLMRTELFGNIRIMDGRMIPTRYEIIPAEDPDQKTIVEISKMEFNVDIQDDFFSQQNMKRIR